MTTTKTDSKICNWTAPCGTCELCRTLDRFQAGDTVEHTPTGTRGRVLSIVVNVCGVVDVEMQPTNIGTPRVWMPAADCVLA